QRGDAMCQLRRVVVGQQVHTRAELDAFGAQQGLSDHQVGCRDRLPGGGEMLPDPGLVIPQGVAQGQVVEIPLMRVVDVPLRWMGWHHKESVLHGSSRVFLVFEPSHQPRAGALALSRVPPQGADDLTGSTCGSVSCTSGVLSRSYSGYRACRLLYGVGREEPQE